jgi:hypothetical protein
MFYETPKALMLKEDYVYGISTFYEYAKNNAKTAKARPNSPTKPNSRGKGGL